LLLPGVGVGPPLVDISREQDDEALRYDQPGKPTLMYQRKRYLLLP